MNFVNGKNTRNTATGTATFEYHTDGNGGRYATTTYRRTGETRAYRTVYHYGI